MRVQAILFVTIVLHALFALAAPVPEIQDLIFPRISGSSSKANGKTGSSSSSGTGGGSSGLFGGNKKTTTPAPQRTTAGVPPKVSTTSSSAAASASASDSAAFCPLYVAVDAADISARDIEDYEKRAGEELWFRFDDPSVATAGNNFLQLAARAGGKNFDDQAYKWISTDISEVTRGTIPKRVPTLYVLPAGTRASILAAAQNFETTSTAKERADFVTKENEPGDVGIQGVTPDANGALPLDTFRNMVIRVVTKSTSSKAGGKATFTTIGADGRTSKTASKSDQAALSKFC